MAARKSNPRRKTTTRRRTTTRRTTSRRRTTRRRRRNPSMDAKGTLMAGAAGALVGAGAYALEGVEMKPEYKALLAAAVGLGVGYVASAYQKPVGAGLAGAGTAIAVKAGLDIYKAGQPTQTKGLGAVVAQMPGAPHVVAQLGAVHAPLGAVQAEVGPYEYQAA